MDILGILVSLNDDVEVVTILRSDSKELHVSFLTIDVIDQIHVAVRCQDFLFFFICFGLRPGGIR